MDNVSKFVAQIQANIRDFERGIKKAQASANAMPDEIEVDVDANISKFRRGLLRAQALAQRFSAREIIKRISIDPGSFRNMYHAFTANFTEPFNRRMGELASNIRTFGVIFGNMIKGSLIASFSALVPIIAGVTSAVMALGNAIGVMVGTLGAFVGAFGIAGAGAAAYGGLIASALSRYNDESFEATDASKSFTRALEGIKSAWSGIVDSHIDAIFTQMATAVDTANFALERMTPFIDGVVGAMGRMTGELQAFVEESPTMLRFFDNLNEKGSTVFENIIRGLGRFGQGIVDMVNAAMPLIEWVAEGFNNLGTQFANWANRMAETNGFHDFINYVKETMPLIGQIFGDFFLGVINLFSAFGENSQTVLDGLSNMMERFKEWSSTIKESDGFQKFIDYIQQNGPTVIDLIGNIIMTIVNFAIAIAPLASKVLELANAFFEWTAELFKSNPEVGKIIGVLMTLFGVFQILAPIIIAVTTFLGPLVSWFFRLFTNGKLATGIMTVLRGAMKLLSGPVGIVITVITMLTTAFIWLYENVEWFRNVVDRVWNFVTTFISQQIDKIIGWFNFFKEEGNNIFMSAMLAIVATIVEGFIEIYFKIQQKLAEILVEIIAKFNEIKESIKQKLEEARIAVQVAWEAIKQMIAQKVAEILTNIIQKFLEIKNNIQQKLELAKQAVVTKFTEMRGQAVNKAQEILSNIRQKFEQVKQAIRDKIEQAKQAAINKFNQMRSQVQSKVEQIRSNIQQKFQQIKTVIQQKVEQAKQALVNKFNQMRSQAQQKVQQILSTIRSKFEQIRTTIQQKIEQAKTQLVNKMQEMATNARQKAQEVYQNIKDKISEVPEMVGGIISDAAQAVTDKASEFVSAGKDLIMGLVDGIKGAAGDAINAAKGVASDAINGAKSLLGINSPSRVFRDIGQYTSQGLAIGVKRDADRAVSEVTRMASDMTDAYKPEFNNINADVDKDINGINGRIRNTVDADITSGVETQRPIVNVKVENQGDVEMIRSAIHTEDGIEDSLAF